MTIDGVVVSVACDVASRNSVLVLPSVRVGEVSVVRFQQYAEAGQRRSVLRMRCLRAAVESVQSVWPNLSMCLFVCTSSWQPKTRVVAYRGVFRSFSASGIDLPTGDRSEEAFVEKDDQVRYFGSVGVPFAELDRVAAVLDYEPQSFLVASLAGEGLEPSRGLVSLWQSGDLTGIDVWSGVSEYFAARDCVVFRPFGFFDDVDVGVDLLLGANRLRDRPFTVGTVSG